ncbi:CBO0543 family protein [Cytobacillus praedii]|uniref:CBO0543 family protein n=1 Tax=Cytobacillus praedii TaxID=1742358 RepID=UPI003F7ED75D
MAYKKEKTIIISSLTVTFLLIVRFVPKDKIREAQLIFLFKQVLTWLFGLIVVEMGLIKYPYRLFFKKASKSSFSFEYFIYPALSVLYNLHYPEKRKLLVRILFNTLYPSLITLLEMIALKYTRLIKYEKDWSWYWSFTSMFITNYLSHLYFKWFFKN